MLCSGKTFLLQTERFVVADKIPAEDQQQVSGVVVFGEIPDHL